MELKPRFDILVPGHYFCDVIFTGIPTFPALGSEIYCAGLNVVAGGVMNTVVALRRLGVNVGWVGTIGDDFFSRFALERAVAEGIDTSLLERSSAPVQRVTVSLSYPEDRAFVTYVDPTTDRVDLVLKALDKADFPHVHFSGLVVEPQVPEMIAACHARGISVSMDCQHRPYTLNDPLVPEILSQLDLFMPNAGETLQLTGETDLDRAISVLADLTPVVLVKQGGKGARIVRGDEDYSAPALAITPLDTTGAGDVFNAGFLSAYLSGHDLPTCLRWGNYCGGMSTLGYGGTSTAPTREQLDAWLTTS